MGGFNIDDGVEGGGFKGQVFGVALDEIEGRHLMMLLAKADAIRIQVEAGVTFWLKGAGEIGGAAAMAAAYFQNVFAREGCLAGDVMIELDASAVGFVHRCEGNPEITGRFGVVGVVEKHGVFAGGADG